MVDGSLLMAAGAITQSTPVVEQELFPDQRCDNGAPFPLGGGAFDQMGIPNPPPSTPPSSTPDGMTPAGTWLLSPGPSTPPSTNDHAWRLPKDIPSPPARSTPSPRSSDASPDYNDDERRRRPPTRPTPLPEEHLRIYTSKRPPARRRTPLPPTPRRPRKTKEAARVEPAPQNSTSVNLRAPRVSWRHLGRTCHNAPPPSRHRKITPPTNAPIQHRALAAPTGNPINAASVDGDLRLERASEVEDGSPAGRQDRPPHPPPIKLSPPPVTVHCE
jgi:hypothetical protein